MDKQKAPNAITHSIIRNHPANKNVIPIDIWRRLNLKIENDTLSRSRIWKL